MAFKPSIFLRALCVLGGGLLLFCNHPDTLYSPSGESHYNLELFIADTTGMAADISQDSIQNILKTRLSVIAGKPITFFGFITGDTSNITPLWDFGDGNASSLKIAEHGYDTTGTFNAVFTITDKQGFNISDTVEVIVTAVFKSAVQGQALYQCKTGHAGICVAFRDNVLKDLFLFHTRSNGVFRIDSGFSF